MSLLLAILLLEPGAASSACPPGGFSAHRIGVRQVGGVGELYDTASGEPFVSRGNNYTRLAWQTNAIGGNQIFYHSTFRLSNFDPPRLEAALRVMAADGDNTVRVFLNGDCSDGCLGDVATGGLSAAYLDNVVEFLRMAESHGIHVILTTDRAPKVNPYWTLLNQQCCGQFSGDNLHYLTAGGLEANRRFWTDFVQGLIDRAAPMNAVLAYELRNELYFESNRPPLSLASGIVHTVNGGTYNMATQKQAMMDENLVYWIDQIRSVIRALDPQALVTVGFFQPQSPNPTRPGDPRVIRTFAPIWLSSADFIDLHAYPGFDLTLEQYVENFEMAGQVAKPILLGEFGAFTSSYSSAHDAALALREWQTEACAAGFDGWLLWTWDTDEQPELYNGASADAVIHRAIAPAARPNPCAPVPPVNAALGSAAIASAYLPGNEPQLAVDGLHGTWWSSGGMAPHWIEVDLGAPIEFGAITLDISQYPAGATVHDVWGKGPSASDPWQLLHEFNQSTSDPGTLVYTSAVPVTDIRFVRVETTLSPSWIAWREIVVTPWDLVRPAPADPTAFAPTGGGVVPTDHPALSWSSATFAETYHVQVATDPGFAGPVFEAEAQGGLAIETSPLNNGVTHYWRVRSGNMSGASGWSAIESFVPSLPLPPGVSLTEPIDNAVVQLDTVTMVWEAGSSEASCYQLQLATDSLFTLVGIDSVLAGTSLGTGDLAADRRYFARVRANNRAGWGAYGPVRRFRAGTVSAGEEPLSEAGLIQIFPNPSRRHSLIQFGLAKSGMVSLGLYDVHGRLVRTLSAGVFPAGQHAVPLETIDMAAGMYFVRFDGLGVRQTRKVILSR